MKSDCAGSSLALQSLLIDGQIYSLNSVVVKKFYLSITLSMLGKTFTESYGIFIASNIKGITFLTSAFLSNFSNIF